MGQVVDRALERFILVLQGRGPLFVRFEGGRGLLYTFLERNIFGLGQAGKVLVLVGDGVRTVGVIGHGGLLVDTLVGPFVEEMGGESIGSLAEGHDGLANLVGGLRRDTDTVANGAVDVVAVGVDFLDHTLDFLRAVRMINRKANSEAREDGLNSPHQLQSACSSSSAGISSADSEPGAERRESTHQAGYRRAWPLW